MKNILVLIGFIVVFGGVIVLVIVSAIRRREITFEGTVIDKNIIESRVNNNMMGRPGWIMIGNMNGGVTHEYKIKVKTDAGKEINYKISEGMYEVVKIGDRASKTSGTTEKTILSSAQPATAPSTGTTPIPPTATPPTVPPQNTNPQSFV